MFLWLFMHLAASAPAEPPTIQLMSCARQAGEYTATLEGRLLLHRGFLDPALSDDENARAAVLQQIKYVWGYVRNDPDMQARLLMVLSAKDPQITILSRKERPYGRRLVLDWDHQEQHLLITDVYTQRAVQVGRTEPGDPGVEFNYRVEFQTAICGAERPENSELALPLPVDPWLMYWLVPSTERRPLRYFSSRAVTNPCADNDFADLPHPIYYWYDWYPTRRGPDDDGKSFDCRRLLKRGVDYIPHRVHLHRTARPRGEFHELRARWGNRPMEPLKATLLMGVLENDRKAVDTAPLGRALAAPGKLAVLAAKALDMPEIQERGARKLLEFLQQLPDVMDVGDHRVSTDTSTMSVQVDGFLRRSHKPLALKVHYGFTNVFGTAKPDHWHEAWRALTEDDLIFYVGHSGIGENLRLTQLEKHLGLKHGDVMERLGHAPFQLMAFLSCYSYMYFGQDLLLAGTQPKQFVYTGTGYPWGERGTLAILRLTDQVLADEKADLTTDFHAEDFLIFKRYPAPPP